MKYVIDVARKDLSSPIQRIEVLGMKHALEQALQLSEGPGIEEVTLRIHPDYFPKNATSDIVERFSCNSVAIKRLFGF